MKDIYLPSDDIAALNWIFKEEFAPSSRDTNIFIAAFTTCYARLRLYEEMEKLGENVLYTDTDSIIYASNGRNDPELGNYLGQLTDELGGKHITTFASGKNNTFIYITICELRKKKKKCMI